MVCKVVKCAFFQMIDDNARYLNIYGSQLKVQYYSGTIFEEYVIDSQPFHFERWISCTVCFTAIFLHLGLHHHHTHVLSILCFILAILALIKLHTKVKKESLLIMKTVGLQITTIFASGRKSAKFVAWERVHGVVINETITMHQVLFYLAILLKYGQGCEKTEILPIFQHTLPRLDCLRKIYKSIHQIVTTTKCKVID